MHNFSSGYASSLLSSGATLYGGTYDPSNDGTLFKINLDGSEFTLLHAFKDEEGFGPSGSLQIIGNTLYGTTAQGGDTGNGTLFMIHADGSGFRRLHQFTGGTDGGTPVSGVTSAGSVLYGTTAFGGLSDMGVDGGTVFSLSLLPELTMIRSSGGLVLSWPTNFTGYILQSTTNLFSGWTTNVPAPVVVNAEYVLMSSVSGTQQFFRLSQ